MRRSFPATLGMLDRTKQKRVALWLIVLVDIRRVNEWVPSDACVLWLDESVSPLPFCAAQLTLSAHHIWPGCAFFR